MNVAKMMVTISVLASFVGVLFVVLFFYDHSKYGWGLVAALICIGTGNLLNLIRMKIVAKKK